MPDPRADWLLRTVKGMGLPASAAWVARVYLVEAELTAEQAQAVGTTLLADSVTESVSAGAAGAKGSLVEVHPLPGVMDPAAQSVREAVAGLTGREVSVSTGWRYELAGVTAGQAEDVAKRVLANPVIQKIHGAPFHPKALPVGHEYAFKLGRVKLLGLSDDELVRMSREAHLFLSLDEMRAVQAEFARVGRDPTDIEVETIAQTWSEHCVHKTLKSTIRYKGDGASDVVAKAGRPGHTVNADGSVTIANLLKSTVAAATFELIKDGVDWTLSVFKDNSGVIALDENWGVCIKVETHNHPSAIEPYGGSATGIGGCIRDVIGTGLGAKPIASTDVFCVASPTLPDSELPPGCIPPKRVLSEVVSGIRDYGNRMGIPTVSGGVYFDDRHVGNPLVFAGCVGLIPRNRVKGQARPGDKIIAMGGRTGRDGIHGATFSSAEMEHTHADEFSHAVQIGNAIEEKRVLDAILRARDSEREPLYHAMTDCGAGGFSSAVGEMGGEIGAHVQLERATLKYAGLSYTEIWISEAQERMVLAVPAENIAKLRTICDEEGVEIAELGTFGTPRAELVLSYHGTEVGRLSMHFLHEGIPTPTREAEWGGKKRSSEETERRSGKAGTPSARSGSLPSTSSLRNSVSSSLLALLSHPNIASKHWIIKQYDHEVQGNAVVKPLGGVGGRGPSDAAVLEPVAGTGRGISISQGLQTPLGDAAIGGDPYQMVLSAVDEVVRNLVCVGTDPARIAILDNFCWPSCGEPRNLGSLVRAAEGCYDAAKAYRTPFVSGKDSLNNQLRYEDPKTGEKKVIEIPPTLLVTGLGIVPAISRAVTMDAKEAGNVLLLVGGKTTSELGGSHAQKLGFAGADAAMPAVDLSVGPKAAKAVSGLIVSGLVRAAHDCSEGGWLLAVAEMLIATTGGLAGEVRGAELAPDAGGIEAFAFAFAENPSRYVLEVRAGDVAKVQAAIGGLACVKLGTITGRGALEWNAGGVKVGVDELAKAWMGTLDW